MHCSHARTLPDDTSRLSCVTHYHPAGTTPFWFRHHPDRTHRIAFANRAAYVSAHYRLSENTAGMRAVDSPFVA